MDALRRFFLDHKRRLARFTALGGVLTLSFLLLPQLPRPLDVELLLGASHTQVVEVRVAYLRGGEEVQGVALAFPQGAPMRVHHSVKMTAGDLEVQAVARRADGTSLTGFARVHAPLDGTLEIRLPEPAR